MSRIQASFCLAVLLHLGMALAVGMPSRALGKYPIAPDFTLRSVTGAAHGPPMLSFAEYAGEKARDSHRVVVLVFVDKDSSNLLPVLADLYKRYSLEGLGIVLVHGYLEVSEREALIQRIGDIGILFPVLEDRHGIARARYEVKQLPSLFLVDGEGRITSRLEKQDNLIGELPRRLLGLLGLDDEEEGG